MTINSKYNLYLNFFNTELKKYLLDEQLKDLIQEYVKLEKSNFISDKKGHDKNSLSKDILYTSIRFRRIFEDIITYLQYNLSQRKYVKFLLELARLSLNNFEGKFAIDLCYKVISPGKDGNKKLKYRAEAYLILSDSFLDQAYWSESLSYLNLAQLIYKSTNNLQGMATCFNRFGIIHAEQGDIKIASEHFEAALKMLKPSKDREQISKIKINLGIIYTILDKTEKAEEYLIDTLETFIENCDKVNVTKLYHNLGMLYYRNGNLTEAQKMFNRSISISNRNDLLLPKCITLVSKAHLAIANNSITSANKFALQGLNLAIKINDRISQAEFYKIYGIIYRIQKNYKLSEKNLLTSLRINRETNNRLNFSETAIELGNLYNDQDDGQQAKYYFEQAKKFYKKNNIKRELKIISDAV